MEESKTEPSSDTAGDDGAARGCGPWILTVSYNQNSWALFETYHAMTTNSPARGENITSSELAA